MSEVNVIQLLLTFLAGAAGAAWAGYLGVRFGLLRLRKERGFDLRLGWYREMLYALHDASKLLDEAAAANTLDAQRELSERSDTWERVKRFDILVAEARAYAPPRTIAALNQTADAFRTIGAAGDPATLDDRQKLIHRQLEVMRIASEALSDDVRHHLGLEKAGHTSWPFAIPDHNTKSDSRAS